MVTTGANGVDDFACADDILKTNDWSRQRDAARDGEKSPAHAAPGKGTIQFHGVPAWLLAKRADRTH